MSPPVTDLDEIFSVYRADHSEQNDTNWEQV